MTRTRVARPVVGGIGTILVLALLLGNQWVVEYIARHGGFGNARFGPLLQAVTFPAWRVSPLRAETLLPADISTLLLLALVGLLVAPAVRALDPRRRGFAAVAAGWWATVVAGALAGLVRGVLFNALEHIPTASGDLTWRFVWSTLGGGAQFGLFCGWLTGLAVLIALGGSRPAETEPAYGPPQPAFGGPQPPPPPPYSGYGRAPLPPGARPPEAPPGPFPEPRPPQRWADPRYEPRERGDRPDAQWAPPGGQEGRWGPRPPDPPRPEDRPPPDRSDAG